MSSKRDIPRNISNIGDLNRIYSLQAPFKTTQKSAEGGNSGSVPNQGHVSLYTTADIVAVYANMIGLTVPASNVPARMLQGD